MRSSPAGSRAWLLAVALACLVGGQAHAESAQLVLFDTPVPAEGPQLLLFDTETTPVVRMGPAALSEMEREVLPAALGVAASREECAPGLVHWLTPSVASRALGAFTRAGAEQVLVSVRFRRCDDVELSPLPGAVVLYEDSEALTHLWRRANVFAVEDVDLDGLLEAVIMTDQYGQGSLQRYASLWAFDDGEAQLLYDFGEVFSDYCGSYLAHDAPVTHSRVVYEPVAGSLPEFLVVSRVSPCRE
jgi:hypothetical protein